MDPGAGLDLSDLVHLLAVRVLFCLRSLGAARDSLEVALTEHEIVTCAPSEVIAAAQNADVLVPFGTSISRPELECSSVRLVQQLGAGMESVDIDAASQLGVYVANVPTDQTANAQSVAELAVSLMLALGRKLIGLNEGVRRGDWGKYELETTLRSSTVGLVGYGGIGRTLAPILRSFGSRVLAVSRRGPPSEHDPSLDFHGTLEDLPKVLGQSDYVVLAFPLNAETKGYFDSKLIAAMKPGAHLINVARGALIEYQDLLDGLASGQLGGAALDVFWTEPFPGDDPIFQYNVIGTPHRGGATVENYDGMAQAVAENVDRVARGEVPKFCMNLDQIVLP